MIKFNIATMPTLLVQRRKRENCFNSGEIIMTVAIVIVIIVVAITVV